MAQVAREAVFDSALSEDIASLILHDITASMTRHLQAIGIEPVFEDVIGIVSLAVVDERHVGTAYLEVRSGDASLRILFADEPAAGATNGVTIAEHGSLRR
jgi:hypothetical protein